MKQPTKGNSMAKKVISKKAAKEDEKMPMKKGKAGKGKKGC